MSEWSTLNQRLAGKWQIPLFTVSVLMLVGAFLRLSPGPAALPSEEAIKHLDTAISVGSFDQAIEFGTVLLRQKERSQADLAAVHVRLARARYGEAREQRFESGDVGRQIIDHYNRALSCDAPLSADDLARMGSAFEWQGKPREAIEHYGRAIEGGVPNRSDLRKLVITLWQRQPDTPPELLGEMIDTLLAELEDHRLDLRLWAIEQRLDIYDEQDELDKVMTLLVRNQDRFEGTDQEDHFRYLQALMLYKTGHYDEAEAYLRTVRNGLDRMDEVHAMTGWLLGRTVLSDGGPQRPAEALSFFNDVLTHSAGSIYAVASRIGKAEGLGMLQRHDEAIESYRVAVEELAPLGDQRVVSREILRTSLSVMAGTQRQQGELAAASEYARLAASITDRGNAEQTTMILHQLAQILTLRADELFEEADSGGTAVTAEGDGGVVSDEETLLEEQRHAAIMEEARATAVEAGAAFVDLARINTLDERRTAEWGWRAAEMYARAGRLDRATRLYEAFTAQRPGHPLVPRGLLRIGQLYQRMGRIEKAIAAYQECYRRFPHTLDGSRALTPLAQCYLAGGPEQEELAERTLRIVLEDSEVFTPQAPEFAEALFMLGDVANRRGAFEEAIATLEETLDRYPDDPRVWRARYLLADSYRHSGLALKKEMAEASYSGEFDQMQAASRARFRKARELYRELITAYELRAPGGLNRLERLYLHHAYLYEADCHFETQEYRAALGLYEDAAGLLRDGTAGLAAYVQIINCHVFLGEPDEAKAALARARILASAIPEEAFLQSVSPERREDWQRYFDWLGESELF